MFRRFFISALSISLLQSGSLTWAANIYTSMFHRDNVAEQDIYDQEMQELILRLARKPELMNLSYLKYFIGHPDNESNQAIRAYKHYVWYDKSHRIRCELQQLEMQPGAVVESRMTFHIPYTKQNFKTMESDLGAAKYSYDQNGQVVAAFASARGTVLAFNSQPGKFNMNKACIIYKGLPLPAIAPSDLDAAQKTRVANIENAQKENKWHEALPLLREHVAENANDGEGHYQLAKTLVKQGYLDEAIHEYQTALSCAADDRELRDKCILDLHKIKYYPLAGFEPPPAVTTKLAKHGRHMRAEFIEKNSSKKGENFGQNPANTELAESQKLPPL